MPDILSPGLYYLTQGFEQNLLLVSEDNFRALARDFSRLSLTDPLSRLLSRLVLGNAAQVRIEENLSIQIPERLLEFAQISREMLLVGQGSYFEIWSPELWQEQEQRLRETHLNADRFHSIQISLA